MTATAADSQRSTASPLSPSQARVWFLQQVDPGNTAYYESGIWRFDTEIRADCLASAIDAVTAAHPMLRMRYPTVRGVPQQIPDDDPPRLEVVDLRGATDAEGELRAAVIERCRRPFDLAAQTPTRWVLYVLGPRRYVFQRVWHHILSDGLSARVLNRDLADAYAAAVAGTPWGGPAPALDFREFCAMQAQELAGPQGAANVEYWKHRLAEAPTLALPTDFERPATQSFRGDVVRARIDLDVASAMRSMARRAGVTTFVGFLTVYATLLARLSGDEEVVIGTPASGRPPGPAQNTIGFFATTLALRLDVGGAASVEDAMKRTGAVLREALDHQAAPFEAVVAAIGGARDPSRNPLFQVAFTMPRRELGQLTLGDTTAQREVPDVIDSRFDLTVSLLERDDGLHARWEYCADLFHRRTIERMARQFATLSASFVRDPVKPLRSLALMDDASEERVVAHGLGARNPFGAEDTIHGRFAHQATQTPDAPAIDTLRYADLDREANRLARHLAVHGVAPGAFVGVARTQPRDIVVAWLAILKAGAAYLPIDPDLPSQRIGYMLGDAGVRHVVADDAIASRIVQAGVTVVCPGRDRDAIARRDDTAPETIVTPESPAYAIYTSGSSGVPKGVVVPHRAVLRLVRGADYVQLHAGDVVAQLANPAFDASTFEFWGALLNGARLAPIPKSVAIAPRALAATLEAQRVTTVFLTTALFNAVAREAPDAFRHCSAVLFGGESVEPRWVREVLQAGPPRRLLHVYGPTETTTFATWHEVRVVDERAKTIPIGRPIANTDAFILRSDLRPAAPGEAGELYIGGPGVAIGYLGAARDTNRDRFVEISVRGRPRGRLYRTGDVCRWCDDGTIEFVGRRDEQVKIRGHRIELREVQSAIARVPGVRDAYVMVRGETSEKRQIVAYAVAGQDSGAQPDVWRALRESLPPYMLPAALVWLPSLPLNANGKVDRRALPEPGAAHRPARQPAGPGGMLESQLVRIFEDLLGVRGIGTQDRFFEIGGHSLLAAELVDTIERETGRSIPLTALFADDTVAGIARRLREGEVETGPPLFVVNGAGTRPPFVFLHGDFTSGGFYSRALAHALGEDQPVLIVHPHGLVEDAIPSTIEAMAGDRIETLVRLRPRGPYVLGGHCNGAFVAFEMARQLLAKGERVPAVVVVDAPAPRSPEDAPAPPDAAVMTRDPDGTVRVLEPRDRLSTAQVSYFRAMNLYTGGPCATHLVIMRSKQNAGTTADVRWSRLVPTCDRYLLPGNHVTLVTQHVRLLARVIGEALAKAHTGTASG